MNRRQRIALSAVHLVCVVACCGGLIWSFMWLASSIDAMSDQLQLDGALDQRRVRELLPKGQTVSEYLVQGHDVRALRWGAGLAALALVGSIAGLMGSVRRDGDEAGRGS